MRGLCRQCQAHYVYHITCIKTHRHFVRERMFLVMAPPPWTVGRTVVVMVDRRRRMLAHSFDGSFLTAEKILLYSNRL